MNYTIKTQINHRTIREFKNENIPENIFEQLIEVGRRTASSTGMQYASIIRVKDKSIREEIAKVCNQEYVARAPELLIFVADCYRNNQISKEKNYISESANDMDKFFQAFTDSCITAQNIVNAAESLGLGTVYLGSILNDSEKICEILKLPQLTFPVVGLGIGYPCQSPQLKPRMDMKMRLYEDSYDALDNYVEQLKDYDEEMRTYYDLRDANNRVDSFTDQVVTRMKNPNKKRQGIVNIITKQGFDLKINK